MLFPGSFPFTTLRSILVKSISFFFSLHTSPIRSPQKVPINEAIITSGDSIALNKDIKWSLLKTLGIFLDFGILLLRISHQFHYSFFSFFHKVETSAYFFLFYSCMYYTFCLFLC